MNMHSLIHLPMFVKLWGPLWCQSSFSFESHNGSLTRMIHSTRKVAEQVSCALDVKQSLQVLYANLEERDSESLVEYLKFSKPFQSIKTKVTTGDAISPIRTKKLCLTDYNEIKKLCSHVSTEVLCFDKLLYDGFILHSTSVEGKGKCRSTYLSYLDMAGEEQFGEAVLFVECSSFDTLALINTFTKTQSDILSSSGPPCYPILEAHPYKGLISEYVVEVLPPCNTSRSAILVSSITSNCVMVESRTSQYYIVKVPNNYEHH